MNAGTLLFPGYAATAEAALYEENGEVLFYPYIKRPCPYRGEMFDICSAYEFGGFWFSTADEKICNGLVSGFESVFREHAVQANIVSEFVRIDPFCKVKYLNWKEYELTHAAQHIIIPTHAGEEAVWKEFEGVRRTEIRQGQKEGLRVEFSQDMKTFTNMYHERLDALNSYNFYYFPEEYITRIEDKKIVFVYDDQGEICSSQAWIQGKDVLFYFLSADVYEKRHLRPSSFAIYKMVEWACVNNIKYIHLGGGTESLYNFKARFSPHRIDYFLAKRILNQEVYDDLVQRHEAASGELKNKGYFPQYRVDTKESHEIPNMRRYTATLTLL